MRGHGPGAGLLRAGLRHCDPLGLRGGQELTRHSGNDSAELAALKGGGKPWPPSFRLEAVLREAMTTNRGFDTYGGPKAGFLAGLGDCFLFD